MNDDGEILALRRELARLREQMTAEGLVQLDLANESEDLRRALAALVATTLGDPNASAHLQMAATEARRVLDRHVPEVVHGMRRDSIVRGADPDAAPLDDDGSCD